MKFRGITQHDDLHLVRYKKRPVGFKEFWIGKKLRVTYQVYIDGKWHSRGINVTAGFTTDLASVPRAARWFASKTDAIEESVVHDFMYEEQLHSKEEADGLFLAMMVLYKQSPLRRNVMYRAVKWFGRGKWED